MPIYEYSCNKCGKIFEYLVFKSEEKPECPYCNEAETRRVMSACGFVSKGIGGETVSKSASSSG